MMSTILAVAAVVFFVLAALVLGGAFAWGASVWFIAAGLACFAASSIARN